MYKNLKIGLGLITCDRENYLDSALVSIINNIKYLDSVVLVNDGKKLSEEKLKLYNEVPLKNKNIIQNFPHYRSVGFSKNLALKRLKQEDCDIVFLMEDDMLLKSPEVFAKYIEAMNSSGIYHMMFAKHGPANRKPNTLEQSPREIIEYDDGTKLGLYPNCVGSFCCYHKNVLKVVGNYDETFKNAWEHVEHTYRIIKNDLHPPFWWFVDLYDSEEYICEQKDSIDNSSIRHTDEWTEGMKKGAHYFAIKHTYVPTRIPDTPLKNVQKYIQFFETEYSKQLF